MGAISEIVSCIDSDIKEGLHGAHNFEGLVKQVTENESIYPATINNEILSKVDMSKISASWHRIINMRSEDVDAQFNDKQVKLIVDLIMVLKIDTSLNKCIEDVAMGLLSLFPRQCKLLNISSCFVETNNVDMDTASILRREFGNTPNVQAKSQMASISYTLTMEGCFQINC